MKELTANTYGIYEILNTKTGQWYRGQAWGQTIHKRWQYHKSHLRNGTHHNDHLQHAWNAYGESAFAFTVFEHCDTLEACNEREAWWIGDDYNRSDVSYNKRAGGNATGEHSNETKRKMSEAHKGAKHRLYAPFTVTFPDGRVDHWDTTSEAAAAYGIGHVSVWQYLRGKFTPGRYKRTAHLLGTVWQYV